MTKFLKNPEYHDLHDIKLGDHILVHLSGSLSDKLRVTVKNIGSNSIEGVVHNVYDSFTDSKVIASDVYRQYYGEKVEVPRDCIQKIIPKPR